MDTVGSHEAKTHLSELLERVARGERILITKRGEPVAMLVPHTTEQKPGVRSVIRKLKELREGNVLGEDLSIRDLIEGGRRF